MTRQSMLLRTVAAVAISLVVVGTVLASGPGREGGGGRPAVPPGPALQSAEPSGAPEALATAGPTEKPEATETPEPSETPDASEAPDTPGAPLSAADASKFVDRLKTAGITVSVSDFAAMAAKVGVGGAVRVFAFAKQSGKSPADILAMFQGGQGWGQIARTLGLNPGIGWIMSGGHGKGHGNGHGHGNAKGSSGS